MEMNKVSIIFIFFLFNFVLASQPVSSSDHSKSKTVLEKQCYHNWSCQVENQIVIVD